MSGSSGGATEPRAGPEDDGGEGSGAPEQEPATAPAGDRAPEVGGEARPQGGGRDRDAAIARYRNQNDWTILVGCLAVLFVAAVLHVPPERDGVEVLGWRLPEVCLAKRMGGGCPGCGLTRSFALGVRGDPAAFTLHPLGPLLLAVTVLQVPWRAWSLARTRRLLRSGRGAEVDPDYRFPGWLVWVLGAAFVVVWLGRLVSAVV